MGQEPSSRHFDRPGPVRRLPTEPAGHGKARARLPAPKGQEPTLLAHIDDAALEGRLGSARRGFIPTWRREAGLVWLLRLIALSVQRRSGPEPGEHDAPADGAASRSGSGPEICRAAWSRERSRPASGEPPRPRREVRGGGDGATLRGAVEGIKGAERTAGGGRRRSW